MPTATPPLGRQQALATRENQGNLAPVETGAVFFVLGDRGTKKASGKAGRILGHRHLLILTYVIIIRTR